MIYKQYTSKELNNKNFPKRGKIVQLSVQSRPGTYMLISGDKYIIGEVGVLELDNVNLKTHLVNDKEFAITFQFFDKENNLFDGAIIDVLYDNDKEEDLNIES